MKRPEGTPSLAQFLAGPYRNLWIEDERMKVYVRRGNHLIGTKSTLCLDIANVLVAKEHQSTGVFTSWLLYAEFMAKEWGLRAVFVESILTPRLRTFLSCCGYVRQVVDDHNMYKMVF